MRVPEGAPLAWVWGVRGRALSQPRLPALWAGCRGPLPTGCGCGGVRAWGPVTDPTARAIASWLCALWGRHDGARDGRLLPGCGASGVGRTPTPDCPPSGRAAGAHYPLAVGAGGVRAWKLVTNPTARALASWLCALWGRHEVAWGGRLLPGCGASGVGRSPNPDCPPSGRAAGAHYPLALGAGGCGRGDPSPTPQRALFRAGFAPYGGGTRAPGGGGGGSCLGVGRPVSGALPAPTARPLGGLPGPTTHWLRVRGVRGWGPVTNPTARALASWFCALWGRHEGAQGGASCLGVGGPESGALPTPTACPLGGLPGPTTHWLWVRGGAGVRTRHQPHSARSFELALCVVGAARGRPGGGASCLGVGLPGSGALPPPTACPMGELPGPTTHWLWERGGAGVGTRHQPLSARSCELPLHFLGAAGGCPGGGASCLGVALPGSRYTSSRRRCWRTAGRASSTTTAWRRLREACKSRSVMHPTRGTPLSAGAPGSGMRATAHPLLGLSRGRHWCCRRQATRSSCTATPEGTGRTSWLGAA